MDREEKTQDREVPRPTSRRRRKHSRGGKGGSLSPEKKKEEDDDSSLAFFTGNPAIEIISGKLRLYKSEKATYEPAKVLNSFSEALGFGPPPIQLPTPRGCLICIIAVPSHISPRELLDFLSPFIERIKCLRILHDSQPYRYMGLVEFDGQEAADEFFVGYNGKLFHSLEVERCKLVYVSEVEIDSPGGAASGDAVAGDKDGEQQEPHPRPPSGMTEIPTCPVCLDRLDMSASGVFTTACNHSFHCACLSSWEDSSCPVCRYCQSVLDEDSSACEVCGTHESLWICLICGHVGCGRYQSEHAKQHYQETLHTYALELQSQRVWDYAGDGYVHRLIQNKQDGKLVEFPDPNNATGERTQVPPRSDAEGEYVENKVESLVAQYNHLLASQLDQQRIYYEERLAAAGEAQGKRMFAELEKDRKASEKRVLNLEQQLKDKEKEVSFLRELNQSLVANQKQWQDRVAELEKQLKVVQEESKQRQEELEAQVRDLMFYLDTQEKVESSPARKELQEGLLMIQDGGQSDDRRRLSRRKKGR